MLLEDQVAPKRCGHFQGKHVIPVDDMRRKLSIALDSRRDDNFVIIARTDARAVEGLNAAIERANLYGELGADICFVEAPQTREELAQVAREVPFPQLANMLPGGVTPILAASELETLGFRIVVDPVGTLLATGHIIRRLAHVMLNDGRIDHLKNEMLTFAEIKQLLGLDEINALSQIDPDRPRQH